ncbi:MAG: hypothetical protein JSV05_07475 [Candidatus Bathyarchaeota archaeon]|nr:MAG: hypothetical protein JSV05_07475 [Candidatus Bathyarchaeota archaeon]
MLILCMHMLNYRLVKLIHPCKSKDGNLICVSSLKVHLKDKNTTIYDTVDHFKNELDSKIRKTVEEVKELVLLKEIINLHNIDGIKSMNQIRTMVKEIKSGNDILSPNGFPNIKLVKTEELEWILFDGHHSLLSYMIAGRTYLHEVPHFIIEGENGHVNGREILIFFGIHSKELNSSNWRKYVINWQAPKERQLCKREQNNMGQLLDSISVYY